MLKNEAVVVQPRVPRMLGKTVDINLDCDHWEEIVEAVDKTDVPVQCLKRLTIKLENGKRKQISITKLRKQGMPEEQIQVIINHTLEMMAAEIKSIDFIVDVESVSKMVKPYSKELLDKISFKGRA